MSKEFIWTIDFEDGPKQWKCVVDEDFVTTYEEGDVQVDKMMIANKLERKGVLQINTTTDIYGNECEFQLEKGVPFAKIGDRWFASDTSIEEYKVKMEKNREQAFLLQIGVGAMMCFSYPLYNRFFPEAAGRMWVMLVLGGVVMCMGLVNYIRTMMKKKKNAKQ